jgi:hypothetical protein
MMKRWIGRPRVAAAILATTLASVGVIAINTQSASAGEPTVRAIGGKVKNHAERSLRISNDWCFGANSKYSWNSLNPPERTLAGNPCHASAAWLTNGGASSERIYGDTDAFVAPAGCITRLHFGNGRVGTIDRRGRGHEWRKIGDLTTAYVVDIHC